MKYLMLHLFSLLRASHVIQAFCWYVNYVLFRWFIFRLNGPALYAGHRDSALDVAKNHTQVLPVDGETSATLTGTRYWLKLKNNALHIIFKSWKQQNLYF